MILRTFRKKRKKNVHKYEVRGKKIDKKKREREGEIERERERERNNLNTLKQYNLTN